MQFIIKICRGNCFAADKTRQGNKQYRVYIAAEICNHAIMHMTYNNNKFC